MTNLSVEGGEIRHGGVIPFHLKERPDCPWCREDALLTRVKELTQALEASREAEAHYRTWLFTTRPDFQEKWDKAQADAGAPAGEVLTLEDIKRRLGLETPTSPLKGRDDE